LKNTETENILQKNTNQQKLNWFLVFRNLT